MSASGPEVPLVFMSIFKILTRNKESVRFISDPIYWVRGFIKGKMGFIMKPPTIV